MQKIEAPSANTTVAKKANITTHLQRIIKKNTIKSLSFFQLGTDLKNSIIISSNRTRPKA